MQYVYKRPDGHYQFRYPISNDVRLYFPKDDGSKFLTHFIGSLGTANREEANRQALAKFSDFERTFSVLRDGAQSPHFAAFFRTVFERELELGRRTRAEARFVDVLDLQLQDLRRALEHPETGELKAVAGWVVDVYFASSGGGISARVPDDTALSDALLSAAAGVLLDVYTQLSAEAKGMSVPPKPRSAVLANVSEAQPKAGESLALSSEGRLALEKYWDVHKASKQGSSSPVTKGTLKKRKSAWTEFQQLLGADTPLYRVTKEMVWRYRDALVAAPVYAGSISELKNLTFPQRVAAAKANPGQYALLDLDTVGDRLRQINAVFQLAVTRGHLDRNPASGIAESKKGKKSARQAYSVAELQKIFSAAPYFDKPPPLREQTDEYWLPLLELFSGARASELYVRMIDVVEDHHVPHILIVPYKERILKTDESARVLPIHPQLVKLGFLHYCRHIRSSGANKLFPKWDYSSETQKQSAGPARRRFNRFLKKVLPERGARTDSHTFRHNFETALTNTKLVDERIKLRLSGRTVGGSVANYLTEDGLLAALAEASAQIKYEGLNLEHLVPR